MGFRNKAGSVSLVDRHMSYAYTTSQEQPITRSDGTTHLCPTLAQREHLLMLRTYSCDLELRTETIANILEGATTSKQVGGLTHTLYRYPARFSPQFARAIISAFTEADDLVLDPFMGGGTTLVEATSLGRRAVGIDINSLANFLTRAKTTKYSEQDLLAVESWAEQLHS